MPTLRLKVPPVAVALAAAALMWALAWLAPALSRPFPYAHIAAVILAAAGFALAASAVVRFVRARTTVWPTRPGEASALVTSGVYRVTRNPMYLGLLLLLAAWALLLTHPLAALILPAFVLYMNRFQIIPEEEALAARFGAEFQAYRARVRRWL